MLLAVVSSSAAAEWVAVGRNETDTLYADPATIRRAGNMVKMWILFDYKTPRDVDNNRYRSTREQIEVDCNEERERTLAASYHAGNMAKGEVIHVSSGPDEWHPVAPGSAAEVMWKFACGKQ